MRPSIQFSNNLDSTNMIIMISENMIKALSTNSASVEGKTNGVVMTKTVLRTERSGRCRKRQYTATADLDGGRAVTKIMSSRACTSLKPYSTSSGRGSQRQEVCGDLLSDSPVHGDNQDGIDFAGGALVRRGKNPSSITHVFCRG